MRHPIVLAVPLLICACASQPPSAVQTSLSPGVAPFVANTTDPATAEQSVPSAPQPPVGREQAAYAAGSAGADVSNEGQESIAQLRTLSIEEADSGRVCEARMRPGSRMTRTVCYTREERLAYEAEREEMTEAQIAELQREQRWRDEIIRQAEMSGRRPSGFGLGPN